VGVEISDWLVKQVADLQHELNEPDVQIRMKSDDGDSEDDHDLDVKLEQVRRSKVKEITVQVQRVRLVCGRAVPTKTICKIRCRKVAVYF